MMSSREYKFTSRGSFFVALFSLCFSLSVSARDTLRGDDFFNQVLKNTLPDYFTIADDVNFPLIEKYEIRTETDEMEFERQEYGFRVSPSTRQKRKAQKDIYNHLINKPDFEREEIKCANKIEANIDWLYLYYYHRKLALITDLEVIYRDRQVVLQQELGSLQYQYKNIIEHEIDRNDLALDKFDVENELDYLYRKYDLLQPVISFEGFIAVAQLPDGLNGSSANTINKAEDFYDLAQIEKEISLEKAEKRQVLDFVQFNYRGPHEKFLNERFSIGAAFNLNNSGSRKLKIGELKLQKQRLGVEMQQDQFVLEEELARMELNIQKGIAYYNYFTEVTEKEREYLKALVDQLLSHSNFDPLHVLDVKERQLQNELEKLKLERELYEQYLEYIYQSESVCEESRLNFLQKA